MKVKDNNKIALFFRVSSEQQVKKGKGLDNQKTIGRGLAKKLGFEIEEFDEGVQSTHKVLNEDREVVLRLIRRIESKKDPIRKVWVYNTNRFGRNFVESSKLVQVFHNYEVEVYQGDSPSPKDLSSFADKFMIDIFNVISSYDNSLRRMISNDGKRSSLLRGNTYIGGTIPFGFIVIKKKLQRHTLESEIVKELFDKYSKNETINELKKWLDSNSQIKPRRSITWSEATIKKMLKNKLYNGVQSWQWKEKLSNGEIKLKGEPITKKIPKTVDDVTFNNVQSRIRNITELRVRDTQIKNKSLLSGLLKCDKCKLPLLSRFRENIGSGNHYYGRCNEHKWKPKEKKIPKSECVVQRSLRIDETNELVLNTLIDLIKKSSTIRETYRTELLNQKETDRNKSIEQSKRIRKKIRNLNKSIEILEENIAIIEVQIVTKERRKSVGKKIIIKSNEEIQKKADELEKLDRKLSVLNEGSKFIDWLDKMSVSVNSIKNQSNEHQRDWIRKFIKNISVEYDDEIKSHKLFINFHIGLVNDGFKKWRNKRGDLIYKIIEGEKNMELIHEYKKRTENVDKEYLKKTITLIKSLLKKGYSNNKICDNLNQKEVKTIRGKQWNKGILIKFRNRYVILDGIPKL